MVVPRGVHWAMLLTMARALCARHSNQLFPKIGCKIGPINPFNQQPFVCRRESPIASQLYQQTLPFRQTHELLSGASSFSLQNIHSRPHPLSDLHQLLPNTRALPKNSRLIFCFAF